MKPYVGNIEAATLDNNNFRRVLYTGPHSQLVVMELKAGEEIGEEVHETIDQFLRVEEGEGKAVLDGVEYTLINDFAVVVPAGMRHNIINTGAGVMKLYTIYTPPEHRDGTVHATKAEALADEADHYEG
jgi:mannose-6-phosphate isomerase-like protein (cupin superfamily)